MATQELALRDHPVRSLKILFSHRTQSRDGQAVHIEELIEALRALGHEVIVSEPKNMKSMQFGNESSLSITIKKYLPASAYELMELAYSLPEFFNLARAWWKHHPDVLYQRANLYMLSGVMCTRLLRLPCLLEVNAPLTEERGKFGKLRLRALAWRVERTAWRSAYRVLPVTKVLARRIEHAGVAQSRVRVIPNGVDIVRFAPRDESALRHSLSLDGKLVLGFTGFVREWHRTDAVINMLAGSDLPPNSHFLIVGDGPVRSALEEQATRLGVRDQLTITGIVPRDHIPDYIRCFDIALQPHVVAYASPLKLLEYMALARAIVAPATPNIEELLTHGVNALLAVPEDPQDYAAVLSVLAHDAALRARLGAAARQTIVSRDLTWRHNAKTVAEVALQSIGASPSQE